MRRSFGLALLPAVAAALVPAPAVACSLCTPDFQRRQTLRQEAGLAKLVVFGKLANARIGPDGNGVTDLTIENVLKDDPFLGGKRTITIPRFVPIDPKQPPNFLIFCDVFQNKLDPYRGTPVQTAAVVEYLKGAMALDEKDRTRALHYYFKHLDSADPDVAADAFLEFAKAGDQEIGKAAPSMEPARLRKLLADPQTPPERLGVFAFLLGACGKADDAEVLAGMLRKPDDRTRAALSGLLGGYIQLKPDDGWAQVHALLADPTRPIGDCLAALGTLRFYHGWKPDDTRKQIVKCFAPVVERGDLADLAVEDLRRWQWWELTDAVLAQYEKKTHSAPLVRRAILRYALTCPTKPAADFIAERRKVEPEVIKEVEEGLQFEKAPAKVSTGYRGVR